MNIKMPSFQTKVGTMTTLWKRIEKKFYKKNQILYLKYE